MKSCIGRRALYSTELGGIFSLTHSLTVFLPSSLSLLPRTISKIQSNLVRRQISALWVSSGAVLPRSVSNSHSPSLSPFLPPPLSFAVEMRDCIGNEAQSHTFPRRGRRGRCSRGGPSTTCAASAARRRCACHAPLRFAPAAARVRKRMHLTPLHTESALWPCRASTRGRAQARIRPDRCRGKASVRRGRALVLYSTGSWHFRVIVQSLLLIVCLAIIWSVLE